MQLCYSQDHEWVRVDGQIVTLGITDYAQRQLGDIVYVELPRPGTALQRGQEAAVVESVKAASEVYAIVGGTVVDVNSALGETPQLVNQDAEDSAWFCTIKPASAETLAADIAHLLDKPAYEAYIASMEGG